MARTMTKSALRLATTALALGERVLPRYGRPHAQHLYTQPQLFALLALRSFWDTDYRTTVTRVGEWAELRRALGLRTIPHYSTLCYAAHRLLAGGGKRGTPEAS